MSLAAQFCESPVQLVKEWFLFGIHPLLGFLGVSPVLAIVMIARFCVVDWSALSG